MRWISSLLIYLGLILVLVCALFLINFGYSDNLSPLSSIFGLGPNSFETKSSDFWFAMFTESIIVFVTFLVVILFIKLGEEKDREPVYKEACNDAYQLYDEIYKFIYHIMAYRMNMEMLEPYREYLKSHESMKNKMDAYEIIKSFFEDICIKNIDVNREKLKTKIDYIYSETENYLQRFAAFLTSEATGNEGSELQKYFNNIRKLCSQLKRSIDSQKTGELLKIEIHRTKEQYSICLGSDSEMIDVPSTIIESMKDRHPEFKEFVEKSNIVGKPEWINPEWIEFMKKAEFMKKICNVMEKRNDKGNWISDGKWIHEWSDDGINVAVKFNFLTIGYLIEELNGVDSGSINRDDCILTWTVMFDKFKEFDGGYGASEAAFNNAEFDFWCMYWDYRHRFLEDAKTKGKRNHLIVKIPKNIQNTQNGPKDFAKVIRKEREQLSGDRRSRSGQDGDQGTAELQGMYKILDICNNDEKAIDVFRRMERSSDDGK